MRLLSIRMSLPLAAALFACSAAAQTAAPLTR
jgi:hypothetical protein